MIVSHHPFGVTRDGRAVEEWTLRNARCCVRLLTYGAALRSWVFDGVDRVIGFDTMADYEEAVCPYIGMVVGRYANRLSGPVTLGGRTFVPQDNEAPGVQLHGGDPALHNAVWQARPAGGKDPGVVMSRRFADGEGGAPGALEVEVTYTLRHPATLRIDYRAVCDSDTFINLTHHAFFNLDGPQGDIRDHRLELAADAYLPVDARLLPLGDPAPVAGTPFDFRPAASGAWPGADRRIGDRVTADHPQVALAGGIDHNFCLRGRGFRPVARLAAPGGVGLMTLTDQPGVQVYLGQGLRERTGKGGHPQGAWAGMCLETQHYPDSPHHPAYPTTFLSAGQIFRSVTAYSLCRLDDESAAE